MFTEAARSHRRRSIPEWNPDHELWRGHSTGCEIIAKILPIRNKIKTNNDMYFIMQGGPKMWHISFCTP